MRQKSKNNNNKLRKFVRQSFASNFLFLVILNNSGEIRMIWFFCARRLILVQVPAELIEHERRGSLAFRRGQVAQWGGGLGLLFFTRT